MNLVADALCGIKQKPKSEVRSELKRLITEIVNDYEEGNEWINKKRKGNFKHTKRKRDILDEYKEGNDILDNVEEYHTIKPFKCDFCSFSSKWKFNIKSQTENKHAIQNEEHIKKESDVPSCKSY